MIGAALLSGISLDGCASNEERTATAVQAIQGGSEPDYVDHVSGPAVIEGRVRNATVGVGAPGQMTCNGVLIKPLPRRGS